MLTFSLLWSLEIRRRNDHIITAVPKGNSSESYKICFSFWIFLHSGHELKFRPGSRQALQNRVSFCWAAPSGRTSSCPQCVSITTGSNVPAVPLVASCVPLRAVVPSLLTNSLRWLSSSLLPSEKF